MCDKYANIKIQEGGDCFFYGTVDVCVLILSVLEPCPSVLFPLINWVAFIMISLSLPFPAKEQEAPIALQGLMNGYMILCTRIVNPVSS